MTDSNNSNFNFNYKYKLLLSLYIFAIITANFLGSKIWEINYPNWIQTILSPLDFLQFTLGDQTITPFSSTSLSFSVALFAFPLTFLITDIVSEVQGNKAAKEYFYLGLTMLGLTLILTTVAVNLPPAFRYDIPAFPDAGFNKPEAYNYIFGSSLRFMIASFIAFGISQTLDIYLFSKIRAKTGQRLLWLRNNGSTITSQFIDTVIFYLIAYTQLPFSIPFLGIEANSGLDFNFIVKIFIPYFIFKVLFAILDTPFVYLGVKWLKKDTDSK